MRAIVKWIIWIALAGFFLIGSFSLISWQMKLHARKSLKATMANVKAWAVALEDYYVENDTYLPLKDQNMVYTINNELAFSWGNVTSAQLMNMFQKWKNDPEWLKKLDPKDGWGRDLQFAVEGYAKKSKYWIRSPGRDGLWDKDIYASKMCWYYDCDIVMSNGMFIQWPAGSSTYSPPFEDNIWGWPLRKAKPPAEK